MTLCMACHVGSTWPMDHGFEEQALQLHIVPRPAAGSATWPQSATAKYPARLMSQCCCLLFVSCALPLGWCAAAEPRAAVEPQQVRHSPWVYFLSPSADFWLLPPTCCIVSCCSGWCTAAEPRAAVRPGCLVHPQHSKQRGAAAGSSTATGLWGCRACTCTCCCCCWCS
jgi:hypothetical protein